MVTEQLIKQRVTKWTTAVGQRVYMVEKERQALQVAAMDLARAAVFGDVVAGLAEKVQVQVRAVARAERWLQFGERRLAFYRQRLEMEQQA